MAASSASSSTPQPPLRIAIIGGGPSGLVTAKTLLDGSARWRNSDDFNVEVSLFESETQVGGTFRYRSYHSAQLVSSKQLTSFSDFRMPLKHNDHLTLPEYCDYLEAYAAHFKLPARCKRWRLGTKVVEIRRARKDEDGNHVVSWQSATGEGEVQTAHFDAIALCTGLHVEPSVPEIPGLPPVGSSSVDEEVDGKMTAAATKTKTMDGKASSPPPSLEHLSPAQRRIKTLHSSSFKDPAIFTGKRVLIMGTGETGMDLSYLAVKAHAREIVLCTRGGFLSFPAVLSDFVILGSRYTGRLPIDGLISNLCETAYVHPWIASSRLRWFVSDFGLRNVVLPALTGTKAGCSQWVGELPEERQGRAFVFLNKSAKAMPYLNRGWKKRSKWAERLARYLEPEDYSEEEVGIDLAPFPKQVRAEDGSVVFARNGRKEDLKMREREAKGEKFCPDVAVYATGYTQSFPFINDSQGEYPAPRDADVRGLWSSRDPSVAFIGFTRPGVGAIPPQAEMSAQLWTLVLAGKRAQPRGEGHYSLLSAPNARIQYGVDYSAYVSQLARDQGSDPGLLELWRDYGAKVTLCYALGAAFTVFYRLEGPWKDPAVKETVETELWDTIVRRGVGGNLMMGVIPMIFYGWINITAWLLEKALNVALLPARLAGVVEKQRTPPPVFVDVRKRR